MFQKNIHIIACRTKNNSFVSRTCNTFVSVKIGAVSRALSGKFEARLRARVRDVCRQESTLRCCDYNTDTRSLCGSEKICVAAGEKVRRGGAMREEDVHVE